MIIFEKIKILERKDFPVFWGAETSLFLKTDLKW